MSLACVWSATLARDWDHLTKSASRTPSSMACLMRWPSLKMLPTSAMLSFCHSRMLCTSPGRVPNSSGLVASAFPIVAKASCKITSSDKFPKSRPVYSPYLRMAFSIYSRVTAPVARSYVALAWMTSSRMSSGLALPSMTAICPARYAETTSKLLATSSTVISPALYCSRSSGLD